jgi:MFS transporter, OFA family, oxalate/formate antiporter
MRNRWIQLTSCLVAMVMIANLQYAWTLFVRPIQQANHWRLSEIQWAFTLFILCETWVMPLEGWIIDRTGPRVMTTIAGFLCGIGWGGLSAAHTLGQFYMFYATAGVGAAFIYSGCIASALKWFPDKRGLASGLIAGGFGSGSAIFIPIIQRIIQKSNYHDAFLYTGIAQGLIIIVVAQFLRKPTAADLKGINTSHRLSPWVRRNTQQFTTLEMLKTMHFYVLYLVFVLMATGGLVLTAQAGPVATEWKIPLAAMTAAIALDRVSNGFSRVFWGWLSDQIGRETTMAVAFALQSFCLASVVWFGRISGTWFTVTLIAALFTYGEVFSLFPSIVGDYFGSRNSASNYGFMYSAKGVASIIGGGIAALLFEKTGTWSGVLEGTAVFALIASLLVIGMKFMALPTKIAEPAPPLQASSRAV